MTDHSDLIERLRKLKVWDDHPSNLSLGDEAASALSSQSLSLSEAREEIERLRERNAILEALTDSPLWSHRALTAKLHEIIATRFGARFMDPPDGGDVPTHDQIERMADALLAAEAERGTPSALENGPAGLADAHSKSPDPDLSSLRKGAEVAGEAAAYDFVAGWHERQAKLFREMAEDDPRTAKPARDRAKEAAIHHAASAAALRNRAADDRRAALVSGSREDGASLLRTIETLPDDFTDGGNCCAGKLKKPRP